MKKLVHILLTLSLFSATALAEWPNDIKPVLGNLINNAHPLSGHIVCWPMNELAGDIVFDMSMNGNVGTITGSWYQNGVKVDVADDRILCDNSVLSQTKGTFICCLSRFDTWALYGAIFNVENSSNNSTHEMAFLQYSDNKLKFFPNLDQDVGDYWDFGNYETALPLNKELTIAVVWQNGGILKGYIDGVETGSLGGDATWTASAFTNSEKLSVAGIYGASIETNAIYKWVYAYPDVLTESQIASLNLQPFCFMQDDIMSLWGVTLGGVLSPYYYFNTN